jgi:sarcosine oxidase
MLQDLRPVDNAGYRRLACLRLLRLFCAHPDREQQGTAVATKGNIASRESVEIVSSQQQFDVIVVGAGIFGISTALELARRGRKVAAIDRFGSGHPATSSTGASRSIRVAYAQPFYVALALEAIEAWRRLERATGRRILHLTGQVDLGPPAFLGELARSVRAAGVRIEELQASDARRRFPELTFGPGQAGLFHAEAGTVMAEEGMRGLNETALAAGVALFQPEPVLEIVPGPRVTIRTDRRSLQADHAVIAAGPWSGPLLADIGMAQPLAPAIAQVTFLDAPSLVDRPGIAEWQSVGDGGVYGHPVPGIGYKIAFDAGAPGWRPDIEEWMPDLDEERRILEWLAQRMPNAPRRVARTQRHPWTMTPDADFIVDRRESLTLACGCSGHAFKFGPALGRLVADIVEGGETPDLLRLDRPGLRQAASPTAPIVR